VGDEQRVRQIVVNLLSNAVKFTPPGGTVTISCEMRQQAAASTHLTGPGPWACIRVEDTGMGIASDEQERVFEPFVQAEARLTRTAGGTGLGLTISRRLARLMGGELTVESRVGAGSTFTLWLPGGATDAPSEREIVQPLRAEPPRPEGLAAIGAYLRARLERVLEDYVERVRRDSTFPPTVRTMTAAQIEDHGITFCADVAQSLVAIEETGGPQSEMLRDGTAIQRFVSELHGQQRARLGWTEAQLTRDFEHLADAIEFVVRRSVAEASGETETAVRVLRQLIAVAATAAHRAFRHASQVGPSE
jgi:Signal transduction histidine kinase